MQFNYKLQIDRLCHFQPLLFSATEIFTPNTWHENQCQKTESIYGACFWSVCHGSDMHLLAGKYAA